MAQQTEKLNYFHLSGAHLAIGSIIEPGNWGRILRFHGWRHSEALKEMALEHARLSRFKDRPSRLEGAFVFLTVDEARAFRANNSVFNSHILYRVTLVNPAAAFHITDLRLANPLGLFRSDWADVYWQPFDPATIAVPGIENWSSMTGGLVQVREMLTLSQLRIEERLGPLQT
jgi:hypothetical protein